MGTLVQARKTAWRVVRGMRAVEGVQEVSDSSWRACVKFHFEDLCCGGEAASENLRVLSVSKNLVQVRLRPLDAALPCEGQL